MAYRFCLGASGAGKSTWLHKWLLRNAEDSMRELSSGSPHYILIVPEQYTMQAQKELILESPAGGIMNVEVLSFGRLSHRVFEETGKNTGTLLNDVGKGLLLRRVAGKCGKELQILGGSIHRQGMISEIKSVLSEFLQYGIGPERIGELEAQALRAGRGALGARLHDLQILQKAFLAEEERKYSTPEERMEALAGEIPGAAFLKGSVIAVDGFTGFTPLQLRVLASLIRTASDVVISLELGEDGGQQITQVEERENAGREQALFFLTRKTVRDLHAIAAQEGLERGPDLYLGENGGPGPRFAGASPLAHLERSLFRYPLAPFEGEVQGKVAVFAASDPAEEVRQICIQVKKLVTEEGFRYRDLAVVAGDLGIYGELLERIGAGYGIPVYLDRTSAVVLNPLTEAIRSALEIPASGFSYESVFRYLRSGMSGLSQQEADLLENYCLEHGIRGRRKWALAFDADCEPLRQRLLAELEPVTGPVRETGERMPVRTAAERTQSLYAFMRETRMEERMQAMAAAFREEGDAVREKQYSQLYRAVIALLEQIYRLLGEEKISAEDYREVLEAGLAEIRLGTIPQQADRLLAGDIERTRLPQVRVLFFCGVNDGSIPRSAGTGGLLSDLDREFLEEAGVELSPAPRRQMYLQRLYLYLNMTKPSDRLILSYSEQTAEGKSLRPSYLIPMMHSLFPKLAEERPQQQGPGEQLMGERDARAWLAPRLRMFADGYYAPDSQEGRELRTVYGFLSRCSAEREELRRLQDAAFARHDPGKISAQTAAGLYGRVLAGSVSRMETAAKCTLRHFLRYGLLLTERDRFEFREVDAGTILHRSVEAFGKRLLTNGSSWRSFSQEEGKQLVRAALQETVSGYHDLLLYDTARSKYQLDRLQRVLERTVETLQFQIRKGAFEPAAEEFSFGGREDRGAIEFELSGDRKLRLIGRIDRLDLAPLGEKLYVKVLDYKSGKRDLDPQQMEAGLQLQLLLYLNAAMEALKAENPELEVVPAAMLYYRMKEPVLKRETAAEIAAEEEGGSGPGDVVQAEIREELRPTGLVNRDREAVDLLDRGLTGKSEVIPVKVNKGGDLAAASKVYSTEEFRALTERAEKALCELAENLLDGAADAAPIRTDKDSTACDYCPYQGACGFDLRIPGYGFRDL